MSDRCKREYRQYRTWVEAGKWGVWGAADRGGTFGVAEVRYRTRPTLIGETPTPLPSLHPGPVMPIFQFAPVGNTEIFFFQLDFRKGLGLPKTIFILFI
jgi:hypothetical protein